jgi:transposase
MPQMTHVLRERAIGMLTAGMSTRDVARKCNVNFSTISHLKHRFREFGSTSNRPHNRRPRLTTLQQLRCLIKISHDPTNMLANEDQTHFTIHVTERGTLPYHIKWKNATDIDMDIPYW